MSNEYTKLISLLLRKSQRELLRDEVKKIKFPVPYDLAVDTLFNQNTDITPDELRALLNGKVNKSLLSSFSDVQPISEVVGYDALREIQATNALASITRVIEADIPATEKLTKINSLTVVNDYFVESNVKRSDSLVYAPESEIGYFAGYGMTREELVMFGAYTGMGKTTLMLCLVRLLGAENYRVLYVSIADWSESRFAERIKNAKDMPLFDVSIYSDATIQQIESDVKRVNPDVLIVDYLEEITVPHITEERFRLGYSAKQLKRMAQDYKILVITAKQLNKLSLHPTQDDLLEAKTHVLKHCDLFLGVGGKMASKKRNIVGLKSRRYPILTEAKILIDFENLTIS